MFYIRYKAVGTFLEDGYPAIQCLRLVEDVETHGHLSEATWEVQPLIRGNFNRFSVGSCDDICALLFTCHDGMPRLVEHAEKDLDPMQLLRHSYERMWKIKVKCHDYDMPIYIPCADEEVCFVYLERLAYYLNEENLLVRNGTASYFS